MNRPSLITDLRKQWTANLQADVVTAELKDLAQFMGKAGTPISPSNSGARIYLDKVITEDPDSDSKADEEAAPKTSTTHSSGSNKRPARAGRKKKAPKNIPLVSSESSSEESEGYISSDSSNSEGDSHRVSTMELRRKVLGLPLGVGVLPKRMAHVLVQGSLQPTSSRENNCEGASLAVPLLKSESDANIAALSGEQTRRGSVQVPQSVEGGRRLHRPTGVPYRNSALYPPSHTPGNDGDSQMADPRIDHPLGGKASGKGGSSRTGQCGRVLGLRDHNSGNGSRFSVRRVSSKGSILSRWGRAIGSMPPGNGEITENGTKGARSLIREAT